MTENSPSPEAQRPGADDERPARWLEWARDTFGDVALDPTERTLRFVEEAVELAQAMGISAATLTSLVERVYARPPGSVAREIGQCQATFELLAHIVGVDPDSEATAELARVQAIPKEEWTRRHTAKVTLGIANIAARSPSSADMVERAREVLGFLTPDEKLAPQLAAEFRKIATLVADFASTVAREAREAAIADCCAAICFGCAHGWETGYNEQYDPDHRTLMHKAPGATELGHKCEATKVRSLSGAAPQPSNPIRNPSPPGRWADQWAGTHQAQPDVSGTAPQDGWRAIAEYPREWEPGAETWWGPNVLLFVPSGMVAATSDYRILTGRLEADMWLLWDDAGSMSDIAGAPTHFRPLPSPPTEDTKP